jgi:hypothetical protein
MLSSDIAHSEMLATLPVGFRNDVARPLQGIVLGTARSQWVFVRSQVFRKNCDKFGAIQGQTNAKADATKSKKGALQGALFSVSRIRGKLKRSN